MLALLMADTSGMPDRHPYWVNKHYDPIWIVKGPAGMHVLDLQTSLSGQCLVCGVFRDSLAMDSLLSAV